MRSVNEIRAARALLGWSARRLADEADVSLSTVQRWERGGTPLRAIAQAIVQALEEAGVEFIDGGVRLQPTETIGE